MSGLPPNLDAATVLAELRAHDVTWETDVTPAPGGWRAGYAVVIGEGEQYRLVHGERTLPGEEAEARAGALRLVLEAAWPHVQGALAWRKLWIVMWQHARPRQPPPSVRAVRRGDAWVTQITPDLGVEVSAASPVDVLREASRRLWYALAHETYCRGGCVCPADPE